LKRIKRKKRKRGREKGDGDDDKSASSCHNSVREASGSQNQSEAKKPEARARARRTQSRKQSNEQPAGSCGLCDCGNDMPEAYQRGPLSGRLGRACLGKVTKGSTFLTQFSPFAFQLPFLPFLPFSPFSPLLSLLTKAFSRTRTHPTRDTGRDQTSPQIIFFFFPFPFLFSSDLRPPPLAAISPSLALNQHATLAPADPAAAKRAGASKHEEGSPGRSRRYDEHRTMYCTC
jgi:hypothetical protein